MASYDVAVIGGGMIGVSVAWRCAQRGLSVVVADPGPGRGAWRTAAGMLAPVTELQYTEPELLKLNLDSLARYPSFLDDLRDETGADPGYRDSGAVVAAWDAADLASIVDLHRFAVGLGLTATIVDGHELRHLEPSVAPGLPGGMFVTDDHQVDPRLLHAAVVEAARRRGVAFVPDEAAVLRDRYGKVVGLGFRNGTTIHAAEVVVAAGSWSRRVADLPVRPVKGQTVRLRMRVGAMARIVRARVKGSPVYVVPRRDGRVVVGASQEDAGFDQEPRTGAVYELLRDAQTVVPELSESVLEEICTGLRPGSPDNAPIVGRPHERRIVMATAHYRHGILQAPLTADCVADVIEGKPPPAVMATFSPRRFSGSQA